MACLMQYGWDLTLPDLIPNTAFTLEEYDCKKGKATPQLPWEVANPGKR